MKRLIIALCASVISLSTWAVKLPGESSPENLPTVIPCHYDDMGALVCRWHPENLQVPIYNEQQGKYLNYNNHTEAVCDSGYCKNATYNNVVGQWKENVHLSLGIWYYVYPSLDGKPIAYRRDVGPKNNMSEVTYLNAGETLYYFLQHNGYKGNDLEAGVGWAYQGGSRQFHLDLLKATGKSVPGPDYNFPVVNKDKATGMEVWCNPQKDDDCYVNNKKVHKSDLGKYLPKVDSQKVMNDGGYCDYPVCYDKDDKPIGVTK